MLDTDKKCLGGIFSSGQTSGICFYHEKDPQLPGVWFIFPWIIKSQEVCCESKTAFSGFDSKALSCEQAFHTSRSNLHTGRLAMVQCFNTKRFSFLSTKAYLLCS